MVVMMVCHFAINGEIGSGKTSVARRLAESSGRAMVNAGDIMRRMAAARGLTTLEANRVAEQEHAIDAQIDKILVDFERSGSSLIYDSRVAWYLMPTAFKVHLIVDPDIAARRLFSGRNSAVEAYRSIEEAKSSAEERYQSERQRFYCRYGIDISRLSNYDLVLDTSDASPGSVAAEIESAWAAQHANECALRISPRRVRQLQGAAGVSRSYIIGPSGSSYPSIIYSRPNLFTMQMESFTKALSRGEFLMPASLE